MTLEIILLVRALHGYIFCGAGERNQGYALLMMANKPETVRYRAPTFSLLVLHEQSRTQTTTKEQSNRKKNIESAKTK